MLPESAISYGMTSPLLKKRAIETMRWKKRVTEMVMSSVRSPSLFPLFFHSSIFDFPARRKKGGGLLVPLPLKASVAEVVCSLRRCTQPPSSATAAIHLQRCSCSRHPWPSSSSPAATICHRRPLTRNQLYCPQVLLQDDRSIPYSHGVVQANVGHKVTFHS